MCFGLFRRGFGRPPTMPGAVGNASQLAITTQPSSTVQNGVNFPVTPVIQLQDAQGNNVALAGVEILISTVVGSATATQSFPTTLGPNGGALTDATGQATYTSLKMTGITGARRIEFASVNDTYTRVLSNQVTIVAGLAYAPQSTVTVNNGAIATVGTLVPMAVQVRDVSGNALTVGGDTVLITVSGPNNVGPAPATDLGNGSYTFSYTPMVSGTDTIQVTVNGTDVGNSPTALVVNPIIPSADSPRLRIGLFNYPNTDFVNGPGGTVGTYRYGASVFLVTPQTISAVIDDADANDVVVYANFAGTRPQWCDPVPNSTLLTYNPTTYQSRINLYSPAAIGMTLYSKIVDALNRRRLIAYVVDEPFHNQFNGSISKTQVNDMCRMHKDMFGRQATITTVRAAVARGVPSDNVPTLYPPPSGGYPDLDRCWIQGEGPLHQPTNGRTLLAFYQNQVTVAASINLKVILGHNFCDGGSATCWPYQNDSGSGRIVGTFVQGGILSPGQQVSCASGTQGNNRWFTPPSELLTVINTILGDPVLRTCSPALMLWSHSPRNASTDAVFTPLEVRPDIAAGLVNLIVAGNGRTSWDDWGTPK